jgi:hypothetical protein
MITHDLDIITAADSSPSSTDPLVGMNEKAFVCRLTQFGDWGNACMTAYGTSLWWTHIEVCARCREVEAQWQREHPKRALRDPRRAREAEAEAEAETDLKLFTIDLATYGLEPEPTREAEVIELPVLTPGPEQDCVDCGDDHAA